MTTHFKICGIRDADTAIVAAEAGAAMLGFVFVEGVRRQLIPERGAEIIAEYRARREPSPRLGSPGLVGLFANQPADFINRIARDCGLDHAQLCGDEPFEFWDELDIPVIRQIKVRDDLPRQQALDATQREVCQACETGHEALLDKYEPGKLGGTGATFDWTIAREMSDIHSIILAGGLTPDNVADAIRAVRPWAVDVSTGVETDGIKDHAKIRAFAQAVQSVPREETGAVAYLRKLE